MNQSNYSFMFELFELYIYIFIYKSIDSVFAKSIRHFSRTYDLLKGLMNIKEMHCHAS